MKVVDIQYELLLKPSSTLAFGYFSPARIYKHTRAHVLAKRETVNINTNSISAFRVAPKFGMLGKQYAFLTPSGDKVKSSPCIQELQDAAHLPAVLAIIKILGHYKLDFLEAKGNYLTDISI